MAWYGELARWILPRPTTTPAGDKPPHYISPSPPLWIPGLRRNDEISRGRLSRIVHPGRVFIQSLHRLAPVREGMRSWSCGLVRRVGAVDSATPLPDPSGGQAPALPRYIFSSPRSTSRIYDSAGFAGMDEPALGLIGGHIPDRSPGHAFVPVTTCGLRTIEVQTWQVD